MEEQRSRRSDRVYLELAIQLSGTATHGKEFLEETETQVIGRHGAKIISRQLLAPQQEISILCHRTGMESKARVIGQIGGDSDGYLYGVELSDPRKDLWGVRFPDLDKSETAARMLLECSACRAYEVAYLEEFALEVVLANDCLWRKCDKCGDLKLWRPVGAVVDKDAPRKMAPADRPAAAQPNVADKRKHRRISLQVKVCLRDVESGEEVTETENVSRGGFRFRSRRRYRVGRMLEAALPYRRGAANIFVPARITYAEKSSAEGVYSYGVSYVTAELVSSLTGMRIFRSS